MLSFFERLVKPFPPGEPTQPPGTLLAFCRHYTRGLEPYLFSMSLLTALIAIAEVSMFGFLGQLLVDWLVHKQPDSLLADEGTPAGDDPVDAGGAAAAGVGALHAAAPDVAGNYPW